MPETGFLSRGPLDLTKLQNSKSHSCSSSSSSRSFFSISLRPKVTGHIYCWKAPCFLDNYTIEWYTTAKDILKMFAVRILQFKEDVISRFFLRTYTVQETTVFTLKYRVSCRFSHHPNHKSEEKNMTSNDDICAIVKKWYLGCGHSSHAIGCSTMMPFTMPHCQGSVSVPSNADDAGLQRTFPVLHQNFRLIRWECPGKRRWVVSKWLEKCF